MTDSCNTCKFNGGEYPSPDISVGEIVDTVKCRRHAPRVTGGMMSKIVTIWPSVERDEWCGDFRPVGNCEGDLTSIAVSLKRLADAIAGGDNGISIQDSLAFMERNMGR